MYYVWELSVLYLIIYRYRLGVLFLRVKQHSIFSILWDTRYVDQLS